MNYSLSFFSILGIGRLMLRQFCSWLKESWGALLIAALSLALLLLLSDKANAQALARHLHSLGVIKSPDKLRIVLSSVNFCLLIVFTASAGCCASLLCVFLRFNRSEKMLFEAISSYEDLVLSTREVLENFERETRDRMPILRQRVAVPLSAAYAIAHALDQRLVEVKSYLRSRPHRSLEAYRMLYEDLTVRAQWMSSSFLSQPSRVIYPKLPLDKCSEEIMRIIDHASKELAAIPQFPAAL